MSIEPTEAQAPASHSEPVAERPNKLSVFHIVAHRDGHTLIDADHVAARAISAATFALLKGVEGNPEAARLPEVARELERLGLFLDPVAPASSARVATPPIPVRSIALFVTQKCNLRCTYCYGDGGAYGSDGSTMSSDTARKSIDWLIGQSGAESTLGIVFFGGEPFINFHLMKEVVAYARQKGDEAGKKLNFSVTTNATLLDAERIQFLKDNNMTAIVSLDGGKELNDKQRPQANGAGSFEAALPEVKKLLAALPDTSVRATLVGDTDPRAVEASLSEIGFKRVHLTAASRSIFENGKTAPKGGFAQLFRMDEKSAELWEIIQARDSDRIVKLSSHGAGRTLCKMIDQFVNRQKRAFICGASRYYVGVSSSGDVFPCHRLVGAENHKLGDVFDGRLERSRYEASMSEWHPKCAGCYAKSICAGGCYHDNLGATGSSLEPDEAVCTLMRSAVEQAGVLSSRLSREDIEFLQSKKVLTKVSCPLDFFD